MKNQIIAITKYIYDFTGKKIFISYFCVFLASVMEVIGLASILPLVKLIMDSSGNSISIGYLEGFFDFLDVLANYFSVDQKVILITLIVFSFILKAIFAYFSFGYSAKLRAAFILDVRSRILRNMKAISYESYIKKDNGEFINVINEQSTRAGYCFFLISQFYSSFLISATFLIATFYLSFVFGTLMMITGLVIMLVFKGINSRVLRNSQFMVDNSSGTAGLISQFIGSFKYLKVSNNIHKIERLIETKLKLFSKLQHSTGKAEALTLSVREPFLIASLLLISFFYLSVFNGNADTLLISIILIYKSVNSFFNVQRHRQSVMEYSGGILKVREMLASTDSELSLSEDKKSSIPHESAITFKNVDFKYNGSKDLSLKEVSFRIEKNQSVAFIGASGSGKTTIIDLISNLLEPSSGEVLYDATKVSGTANIWEKGVGYVTQSPYLYDDTIERNICMEFEKDIDDISRARVEACAKNAFAHDFINKLPYAYNTRVGENGISLSGGQKQRIALAREYFSNSALLIFDEATSALDSETESIVNNYINSLKGKKTIIIVAHRISTIKNVDKIYVLDDGKIVEDGTYMQLVSEEDSYLRRLIAKQLI